MFEEIISGGQTGVDHAALDVALELGIPCGGWCPKGRKKKCKGVYRPALMRDDWKECPDCGRTGRAATGRCGQCDGVGWLYVNSHPKPKQKDQIVQPELFHNLKTGPNPNHGKG